MRNIGTYLLSLFLSLLLVAALAGSVAMSIADVNITPKKASELSEKKRIASKVVLQLDRYYREKSGSTGIPADVYMTSLDEKYISSVIDEYINADFEALKSGNRLKANVPENKELEASIDKFFNDYADETGYERDEAFDKKLEATKSNAYKTIGDYCDIYKASSLDKHGVLAKASKLYRARLLLTFASAGGAVLLILFLIAVNRKEKRTVLYWTGISSLISGAAGAVPSIYLLVSKYYDSFSIKQPQIFRAYTTSMYKLTEAYMAVSTAVFVIGIALIVVYGVSCGKGKNKAAEKQDK